MRIVSECRLVLLVISQVLALSLGERVISLCRMKRTHISQVATLCTDEFLDPTATSKSTLKQERQWICSHLDDNIASKSVAFFVATIPLHEPTSGEAVADPKSAVVGFVEVALSSEASQELTKDGLLYLPLRPKITSLVVAPAHRGRGLGRALVAACAAQSRRWIGRSEDLFLEVRDDNVGARSFYEKLGFRICPNASLPVSGGDRGGRGEENSVNIFFRSGE
jgi:ribosomal protein S18 acetylase RimI-like enzyme